MFIDNETSTLSYSYGLYNGKPAYEDYYRKTIYVFKDISPKRIKTNNVIHPNNRFKVVFVSNKQLLSMDYMHEIKNCVFDGKLGTSYRTKNSYGPYFHCLRDNGEIPKARV